MTDHLARLLSALAARSLLLGLVSAAAAAAATLGAARAFAAPAGGSGRIRDGRGPGLTHSLPGLTHSLLSQPFVLLVVFDTRALIFGHGVLLGVVVCPEYPL